MAAFHALASRDYPQGFPVRKRARVDHLPRGWGVARMVCIEGGRVEVMGAYLPTPDLTPICVGTYVRTTDGERVYVYGCASEFKNLERNAIGTYISENIDSSAEPSFCTKIH